MKSTTLDCIAPLLGILRGYSALREVRPTVFHLNGKDFIHFHEEVDGIFADVRLSKGQARLPVSTHPEQSELLERIEDTLAALEAHSCRQAPPETLSRLNDERLETRRPVDQECTCMTEDFMGGGYGACQDPGP